MRSASITPVSYTHLDVYKRQALEDAGKLSGTVVKEIYVPGKIINIVAKP